MTRARDVVATVTLSLLGLVLVPISAAAGKFRATTTIQWKLGAGGKVRTGRIISDSVRKSRLCG